MARFVVVLIFLSLFAFVKSSVEIVRGVILEHQSFYNPNQDFVCLDQSARIPFSSVNDDFCDCADGSDEPGTSACPDGKFFCSNLGHIGEYIQSSRVNDGICDCCDGSDEYDSTVACFNECQKHQEEAAEKHKKQQEITNKGFNNKVEMIRTSQLKKNEKQTRFATLNEILETRRTKLEELRVAKEIAENPEKAAKEKHENEWNEVKAARQAEKDAALRSQHFAVLDTDKNGWVSYQELVSNDHLDADMEEEAAKGYLDNEEMVDTTKFVDLWNNIKDKVLLEGRPKEEEPLPTEPTPADDVHISDEMKKLMEQGTDEGKLGDDMPPPVQVPEYDQDGEGEEEDDDEDEEEHDPEEEKQEEKIVPDNQDNQEDKMPEYDEQTKELIRAADEARKAHDEHERELKDLEREHKEIQDYLAVDFGHHGEFASLQDQCFEYTDREYTYKLCPFNKITQRSKNGGSETDLGRWGSWGELPMKYSVMQYKDGAGCWNGPARSTKVTLSCGAENELVSVSEPSRCEYAMEFYTPALCEKPVDRPHTEL